MSHKDEQKGIVMGFLITKKAPVEIIRALNGLAKNNEPVFHEFDRNIEVRPFLKPAMDSIRNSAKNTFEDVIKKAVKQENKKSRRLKHPSHKNRGNK